MSSQQTASFFSATYKTKTTDPMVKVSTLLISHNMASQILTFYHAHRTASIKTKFTGWKNSGTIQTLTSILSSSTPDSSIELNPETILAILSILPFPLSAFQKQLPCFSPQQFDILDKLHEENTLTEETIAHLLHVSSIFFSEQLKLNYDYLHHWLHYSTEEILIFLSDQTTDFDVIFFLLNNIRLIFTRVLVRYDQSLKKFEAKRITSPEALEKLRNFCRSQEPLSPTEQYDRLYEIYLEFPGCDTAQLRWPAMPTAAAWRGVWTTLEKAGRNTGSNLRKLQTANVRQWFCLWSARYDMPAIEGLYPDITEQELDRICSHPYPRAMSQFLRSLRFYFPTATDSYTQFESHPAIQAYLSKATPKQFEHIENLFTRLLHLNCSSQESALFPENIEILAMLLPHPDPASVHYILSMLQMATAEYDSKDQLTKNKHLLLQHPNPGKLIDALKKINFIEYCSGTHDPYWASLDKKYRDPYGPALFELLALYPDPLVVADELLELFLNKNLNDETVFKLKSVALLSKAEEEQQLVPIKYLSRYPDRQKMFRPPVNPPSASTTPPSHLPTPQVKITL